MALGKVTVATTGKRELDRMFRKLKLDVKEKELRKGHRSAGRILVKAERDEWRKNHGHNSTGATERSIGMVKERNERGQVGSIGVGPIRRRDRARSGWKAHLHEFGTKFMRAKPSIEPAWEKVKDKVNDIIGEKLGKTMQRTMRRNAKRV